MFRRQRSRMVRARYVPIVAAIVVALLLAACGEAEENGGGGSGGPTPTSTSGSTGSPTTSPPLGTTTPDAIPHEMGANDLVLRISTGGGFVPQEFLVTDLPEFSLYGDGTLITEGPQIEIFPAPALPNLQVTKLSEEGVQAVLRAAREAGLLDGDKQYTNATVADAPTTTFTTNAGGRTSVVSVYALGFDVPSDPSGTDEAEARRILAEFRDRALDVTNLVAAPDIVAPTAPYEIERLQLVWTPAEPAEDGSQVDWPLATPIAEFGEPYFLQGSQCGVVEGADLMTLLGVMRETSVQTRWQSEGDLYILYPRPLLPDETGCPGTGEPVPPTPTPGAGADIEHPTGADELVLRIDITNGFLPPYMHVIYIPMISVYGDGSVIVEGPVVAIYPPPALPNLQVGRLTEEQLQTLLRQARDAGLLDGDQEWTMMTVADAPTTYFYTNAGGRVSRVSAYALDMDMGAGSGMSPEEQAAREKLNIFMGQIGDVLSTIHSQETTAFEIERLQLVVQPGNASFQPVDEVQGQEVAWPLTTSPAEIGQPFSLPESRCVVLEGHELATMLEALGSANQLTLWSFEDELYAVYPRPLLPGEQGCREPGQTPF